MKKINLVLFFICCSFIGFAVFNNVKSPERKPAQAINQAEALKYLDSRSANWLTTSISNQHNGGKCLSCHTSLAYVMVRPEHGDTPELQKIREYIEKRVKEFSNSGFRDGWYAGFEQGSLSTEVIINAIGLTSMDLANGNGLTPITESALKQLWLRQIKTGVNAGGFEWLDGYNLAPLESTNAGYWASAVLGSSLTDIEGYTERPESAQNIKALKKYLADHFDEQNLHNQLMAIEADKKFGSNVIPKEKVKKTLAKVLKLAEDDGGWDLHKLLGREGIGAADNYATAIVIKAFVGVEKTSDLKIKKAIKWLRSNQNTGPVANSDIAMRHIDSCTSMMGAFLGHSVNFGKTSLFMTDLATAFSIKALNMATKAGL
jgi:hypothetical protein